MLTQVTSAAENELLKEALLMSQVLPHTNLVSIIGVITRGRPKTLVRLTGIPDPIETAAQQLIIMQCVKSLCSPARVVLLLPMPNHDDDPNVKASTGGCCGCVLSPRNAAGFVILRAWRTL